VQWIQYPGDCFRAGICGLDLLLCRRSPRHFLRLIAAGRGAMDSLMAEVMDGHFREHALSGTRRNRSAAADELTAIVRAYLR
jgi:hypothetical protein